MIHPAPPATKDQVPTLLNVVAPPPKYFPKLTKHEDKPVLPSKKMDSTYKNIYTFTDDHFFIYK